MALETGSKVLKRVGGKSSIYPPDEVQAQIEAQELLHDAQQMLDDMVEQSACSICYLPLRSMHIAHCGHSHCTQCIRNEFKEKGERRPVRDNSLSLQPKAKVYAQCPTCRVEIGLDLTKHGILSVPVVITAEKHLVHLRKWAKWRRARDDKILAQGLSLPKTACSWRQLDIETEAHYKTRAEEEAEDDKKWLTDKESDEDESEYETYRTRPRDEMGGTLTADVDTTAQGNEVPGGRPPAASSYPGMGQSSFSGGWPTPGSSYSISVGLPFSIAYHQPPPRTRSTSHEGGILVGDADEEQAVSSAVAVSVVVAFALLAGAAIPTLLAYPVVMGITPAE
ncbi:tripartite motif-containing 31 [Colletotrichum tofieldiae]|nr:tripartite motif-containing 31 [Colletotrichum tofieldiae]GKT67586.1 tripartite motif-containing 31 [Colletotrichum tofieldiae]